MEVYTKDQLKNLKQIHEEEMFKKHRDDTIKAIYMGVIDAAKQGHPSYTISALNFQLKDISLNIVIEQLKTLFPDANIMYIDRVLAGINIRGADLNKTGIISINWA